MDLNMLITTIITSTSALVAIIGGFLVSKVITLSSERASIENRLIEIYNMIKIENSTLRDKNKWLLDENANDFIIENHKILYDGRKKLKNVIDQDEGETDLSEEELIPYVELFLKIKEEVFDLIENYNQDSLPDKFNKIISGRTDINYPDRKVWYELIYDVYFERNSVKKTKLYPFEIVSSIPNSYLFKPSHYIQMYNDKLTERDTQKEIVYKLEVEKNEMIERLKNMGKPEGLWYGLGVLTYACIVGIIYPSFLLPYPINFYNDTQTKALLLTLFFSELIVLLLYLAINIYKLSKIKKN